MAIIYPDESYPIMEPRNTRKRSIDSGDRLPGRELADHGGPKATGYKLGLIVNFGHHPKVEYRRIVV